MDHTTLMVMESSLKWRNVEPEEGAFFFDTADAELAWARERGLVVKGHTLLWDNAPPLSCREMRPMFVVAPALALGTAVVSCVLAHHWDYPPAQLTVAALCAAALLGPAVRRVRRG